MTDQPSPVNIPGAAEVLGITEEQVRSLMGADVLVPTDQPGPDAVTALTSALIQTGVYVDAEDPTVGLDEPRTYAAAFLAALRSDPAAARAVAGALLSEETLAEALLRMAAENDGLSDEETRNVVAIMLPGAAPRDLAAAILRALRGEP